MTADDSPVRDPEPPSPGLVFCIRATGVLAIFSSAILFLGQWWVIANPDRFGFVPETALVLRRSAAFGALLIGGVATVFLRKTGLLVVAALFGIEGITTGVGSIGSVPFPWLLVNLGFGAVFLTPCALLAMGWRRLRW